MRRLTATVAASLLMLSLVACSPGEDKADTNPGKGNDGVGSAKCGDQ